MKLRRTLALAAATAVIGPVVLLSAPAAFAETETTTTETTSPAPTETPSETPSATETPDSTESASQTATTTPSETESSEGVAPGTTSPTPTATESETASAKPTPTASETEDEGEGDDEPLGECEPRPLELSINGLSGKIARGSGWDRFTFNIYNDSKKTVKNVAFFAGAAADKAGEKLFTTKQVRLQALNEADGTWEDIEDLGSSSGYVGETDSIKPGYEVDIDLRLKVEASAPVGAGFSLGGGLVFGDELEAVPCFQDVAYKFQIVDTGNGGGGTEPQEGGKIPVPDTKPVGDTAKVTGNLAETGSSSTTPVIALAGGAAVVLGAGAMFVVRRRKSGDAAA
ncbi:LAETG motif-containing sortase-dependent surface protein [Streptomyces sp. JH34]|uniref:LAETG motif-containing sortase-dependent surface protein n=1 Tax=Streptomyces sp. JH34 TaxID=2793633 RepID=UPI0023F76D0E|nr:LAETG motif-containing sortase-dependent surface protein [Streptomyces sp. JH34]MDF6019307.1 LPXTG cell wall anchor domain-containing protein [Streptomyces sp. JH34]